MRYRDVARRTTTIEPRTTAVCINAVISVKRILKSEKKKKLIFINEMKISRQVTCHVRTRPAFSGPPQR